MARAKRAREGDDDEDEAERLRAVGLRSPHEHVSTEEFLDLGIDEDERYEGTDAGDLAAGRVRGVRGD